MNDFIEIETDEEREAKRRVAYVKGLRDFAAFLETTDAPIPVGQTFNAPLYDKEKFKAAVKVIAGRGKKSFDDSLAYYRADFETLTYQVYIMRNQVCERIVTGTKEVPAISYPAHTEEIVEWKCEPWLESPKAD